VVLKIKFNLASYLNTESEMAVKFKTVGYSVDYLVQGKYVGSIRLEQADRTVFGYAGRKTETLTEDIQLSNKRKIKKGTLVTTELFPLNGRIEK
jgi:hypothetical protein